MIRVVSFDIGGTLIQYQKSDNLIDKIASIMGVNQNVIKEKVTEQFIKRHGDINLFCQDIGYDHPHLVEQIITNHKNKNKTSLYNDVVYPLKELKQSGFRLVAISNNFSWNESNLDFYGLGHFFELEVYSFEVGCMKPDTRIFRYVEDMMKVKPREVIHIGDSIYSDVQGANNASWYSVLIRRPDGEKTLTRREKTPHADFTISNMIQLISVIHHINQNDLKKCKRP